MFPIIFLNLGIWYSFLLFLASLLIRYTSVHGYKVDFSFDKFC